MRIVIAGDYCPQNRVADLFEHNNFGFVLEAVKGLITDADYSIVNLECPVARGEKPIEKIGPSLQCTDKGVEALKWVGFNCVTLANNHFLDYGEKGVLNTINECKKNGIDTVGGGASLNEASKILYKDINETKIAIINCCENEFSIATETSAGSNPLNPIQQYYSIKDAKAHSEYVIVIVHGGHEMYQLPSPRMQETYRFFIDAGADVVINHHQHCFSGYEYYCGKPIFYGLGNFCFDGNLGNNISWNQGFILAIDIEDDVSYKIIPYSQCDNQSRITLLGDNAFGEKINELNCIITDSQKLKSEIRRYYSSCMADFCNLIEPLGIRPYIALKNRGLLPSFVSSSRKMKFCNYVRCEAHRDKFLYFLCDK